MNIKFNMLNFRQAKIGDIDSIAKIKVKGWQSAYRGIIDDEYLDSMSVSEQIDRIKKYSLDTIFVAECDNEILGFCRIYDYDVPIYSDKKIDCEIREIYVRSNLKRMGIGSKLFNHILEHFRQLDKEILYLGCFDENYGARKFYEKMGGLSAAGENIVVGSKCYPTVSYIFYLSDLCFGSNR